MAYRNGLLAGLLEAELLGRRSTYGPVSFTQAFTCQTKHAGIIRVDPDGEPCPPYSITYNKVANGCRFLTVGDEEGCVSIVDTNADTLPSSLYTDPERPPRAKWLAHNNTIFDMAWAKHDSVLYTASGDQHVGVWDTAVGRLRVYCAGHDGSVKAVCPHSTQPDVFASGSRDGGILLWDLRMPSQWHAGKNRMQLAPVNRIDMANSPGQLHGQLQQQQQHTPGSAGKHQSRTAGSSRGTPARATAGNCRRSVTSLLFVRNEHTMISSSDMDGIVRLWDLRKLNSPTGDITIPSSSGSPAAPGSASRKGSAGRSRAAGGRRAGAGDAGVSWLGFTCLRRSSRPAGITCMALSPAGDMLLVSSIDSSHYMYSLSALDQPPVATFTGHRSDSFCIKSCFSPCGRHILSGSSDRRAYIWDVSHPSLPPVTLSGHAGEVTAVAWCPTDYCQIATAADDATLRVWAMDRNNLKYQLKYQHCNYLFEEAGQQHGLWGRLGFGNSRPATAKATAAEESMAVQAQQQEVATAAAAMKMPPPAAAGANAAAAPSGSAATAGGIPVAGKASICSPPVTPQLPFRRKDSPPMAGSTPGGAVAAAAGAADTAAAAGVCQTPASREQCKACPGSAKARSTTPRLRQLLLSEQLSSARITKKKQAATGVQPAAPPAAEEGPAHKQQLQQEQHNQQQQYDTKHGVPMQNQLLGGEAAPTTEPAPTTAAKPPMTAAPAVSSGAGSPAGGAQAFAEWMKTLTPSPPDEPSSSQHGNTVQQQRCGFSGGLFGSSLPHRHYPSTCKRGGVVELSTPWALPTPLRQQRLAEQAALEAERAQQSQRLQGLSLHDRQQLQQDCDWDDVPRQLQDEFEVFCDEDGNGYVGGAAAAADSAGTPVSSCPQENMFKADGETAAATKAAHLAGSAGARVGEKFPHSAIDLVPSSLPADMAPGTQTPDTGEATQQDPQQPGQTVQGQTVQAVHSLQMRQHHHQQVHQQVPVGGVTSLLQAAGQKPGEILLGGVGRTPFGDLSTLLPAPAEVAVSPGGHAPTAAGSTAVLAARGRGLAGTGVYRNSPVRTLNMSAAGGAALPAAAAAAGGAADSPLLLMLQHARLTSQQQQRGVAGLVGRPSQQQLQLVSPMRQSPVHGGEAHKRLSRLGEKQVTPITFAVHQAHQHEQPQQLQQSSRAAACRKHIDVNTDTHVLTKLHDRVPLQQSFGGQLGSEQQLEYRCEQQQQQQQEKTRQPAPAANQRHLGPADLQHVADTQVLAIRQQTTALVEARQDEDLTKLDGHDVAARCKEQQQEQDVGAAAESQGEACEPQPSSSYEINIEDEIAGRMATFNAWQAEQAAEEAERRGAAAAAATTAAVVAARPGGIKRSAVPPSTAHKRQCTLADLWTAKPPEVEDGESRFSAF